MATTRSCSDCKRSLPLSEFHRNKKGKYGTQNYCKDCARTRNAEYRKNNRQKMLDASRRWYRNNTGRAKELARESLLRNRYGITPEVYDQLLQAQSGSCASCSQPPPPERLLFVDHNHHTGRVRGLLCYRCNSALGLLGDSSDGVKGLLSYIQDAEQREVDV